MNGVRDSRQREAALASALHRDPEAAAWWIHEWLVCAHRAGPGVLVALDSLAMVLTRPEQVSYEQRAELYRGAKLAQLEHVAFMMLEPPATDERFDAERALDPRSRPLTLGERKSLARGSQRQTLDKLIADPHPQVVEILLANPRLTEREVLRITSRRPVSQHTLMQVVMNEKFRRRHAVRRSLCLNPHLPVPVAARLCAGLRDRDLREVGSDRNLPAHLRLHAKTLLDLRQGPTRALDDRRAETSGPIRSPGGNG